MRTISILPLLCISAAILSCNPGQSTSPVTPEDNPIIESPSIDIDLIDGYWEADIDTIPHCCIQIFSDKDKKNYGSGAVWASVTLDDRQSFELYSFRIEPDSCTFSVDFIEREYDYIAENAIRRKRPLSSKWRVEKLDIDSLVVKSALDDNQYHFHRVTHSPTSNILGTWKGTLFLECIRLSLTFGEDHICRYGSKTNPNDNRQLGEWMDYGEYVILKSNGSEKRIDILFRSNEVLVIKSDETEDINHVTLYKIHF